MPKINAPTIDEHKTLTRHALLEAGVGAFVNCGLAGTSIGTLADTAGIARTTVYEYFPNKESVLAALIYEKLPPIIDQLLADLPEGSALDRVAALLERSLRFVLEYPVEAILLFRVSRELPKSARDTAWSVLDPVRQELGRLCREGVASGAFPDVDPVSLGRIIADHIAGGIDELSARGPDRADTVLRSRMVFLSTGLKTND